jgi:hypothetical protein
MELERNQKWVFGSADFIVPSIELVDLVSFANKIPLGGKWTPRTNITFNS